MAITINLKLTGEAEKLIKELREKKGMTDADIIARALGLLAQVWRTKRVAMVGQDYSPAAEATATAARVEYYFGFDEPEAGARQLANIERPAGQPPPPQEARPAT